MLHNHYIGLPMADLKTLLRNNKKKNPEAVKLIEEAIAAGKTHKRGSLKEAEMQAVAECLDVLFKSPMTDERSAISGKLATAIAAVCQFKIGAEPAPSTPTPIAPASPTPATAS